MFNLSHYENWSWGYDAQLDHFSITVYTEDGTKYKGNTLYGSRVLSLDPMVRDIPSTNEDPKTFLNFLDSLSDVDENVQERTMIALNATALKHFHKKLKLNDYSFQQIKQRRAPEIGDIGVVATSFPGMGGKSQEGNMLVVDVDNDSCYGILISSTTLIIDAEHEMRTGSCVHLSNDRTISVSALNTSLIKTLNIA